MRQIYESSAVRRDDDDPFTPSERGGPEPQTFRSIPATALSRLLLSDRLRDRAISVSVTTPRSAFSVDSFVPFQVTIHNAFPLPVTIATLSPLLWTWSLDGLPAASQVSLYDPPAEPREFRFGRGERKRFRRQWNGQFRVTDSQWEPADTGEHTIAVELNVENAADRGLRDETTVKLVSPST